MNGDVSAALEGWRSVLGEDRVRTDTASLESFALSASEHRKRQVLAVVQPRDRREVEEVLRVADRTWVPVYPISTGKNWGLGSKLPIVDGCAVLDLSQMNRIREVSAAHRFAVVEPGVTQQQLAAHLRERDLPLVLNVTGAGGHTGLVGNALERGVGILGQRQHEVRGLEAVLAGGRVVRTGLWHYIPEGEPFAHHYPSGLGPDLTGLFLQSNLGVVTAMVLSLSPRQEVRNLFFEVPDKNLEAVVDTIAHLRASRVLGDRIELDEGSDGRLRGLIADKKSWGLQVPVFGTKRTLDAHVDEVCAQLEGLCGAPRVFAPSSLSRDDVPEAARVRLELLAGHPTNYSLESIVATFGSPADDIDGFDFDHHRELPGFLCVLPVVPLRGGALREVIDIIRGASRKVRGMYGMSFNTVGDSAMEGYIRVVFGRKSSGAIKRAHQWCANLHERLRAAGTLPMRLDIDQMPAFVDPNDDFWATVSTLKRALDPNGIIAPGRYAPLR